jgi:hypothetical protein
VLVQQPRVSRPACAMATSLLAVHERPGTQQSRRVDNCDADGARSSRATVTAALSIASTRVPMCGCLGAHDGTAASRGLLRLRRPTLSRAGATPAMPAASLVTFPDAGRCRDLGISPGDSVVASTVADVADKLRRACPRPEGRGLRATFSLVTAPRRLRVGSDRRGRPRCHRRRCRVGRGAPGSRPGFPSPSGSARPLPADP